MRMSADLYRKACRYAFGYCTACRDVTEFEGKQGPCPECGKNTLIGPETALAQGHITITEDIDYE